MIPSSDFTVTLSQVHDVSTPKAKVLFADVSLQTLVGTGININVIDETAYRAIIIKSP